MAQHNILGKRGEDEACLYLIERDIRILERNWHGTDCEIDIIADDYGEIVFIEVKTRTNADFELPEHAVDAFRIRRMSMAAEEYLLRNDLYHNPYRFDIIALDGDIDNLRLRHIRNAFDKVPRRPRRP